jgi:hypothetical protein
MSDRPEQQPSIPPELFDEYLQKFMGLIETLNKDKHKPYIGELARALRDIEHAYDLVKSTSDGPRYLRIRDQLLDLLHTQLKESSDANA